MTRNPIVPTNAWKQGLIAVYAPVLEALGATPDQVSTQNDGSVYVDTDTTPEAIEAVGAYPMSERPTRKGWHIVTDEGMAYAAAHHPSEGRVSRESEKRELSPEQQAREEQRKALKARMQAIKDAQKDAQEGEDE